MRNSLKVWKLLYLHQAPSPPYDFKRDEKGKYYTTERCLDDDDNKWSAKPERVRCAWNATLFSLWSALTGLAYFPGMHALCKNWFNVYQYNRGEEMKLSHIAYGLGSNQIRSKERVSPISCTKSPSQASRPLTGGDPLNSNSN